MSESPESPGIFVSSNYKNMEVTCMKIVCILFSIGTYVAEITLDIMVAVRLYKDEEHFYFGLTTCLMLIQLIVVTVFSVWWYLTDKHSEPINTPPLLWFIRVIFLASLMAPVLRNLEALYYAIKSVRSKEEKDKKNYLRKMAFENADAAILRLIGAFIECAPQVVLQLHILAKGQVKRPNDFSDTDIIQLISVFTSLLSLSCAVTSHLTNRRESLDYKNDLNCSVAVFPFLWRFCELTSRLLILGLFSSILLTYFALIFLLHSMIMFVMSRLLNTKMCGNKPGDFLYNMLLSYMCFFCFINPRDDYTRPSYTFYYGFIFVENTIMVSVWYVMYLPQCIYRLPLLITVFVSYTLAILTMVFYYILLHPTIGKFFGRPSPINPDETLQYIENIAREYGLSEDIISRFRAERENIPLRNAADFFQNVSRTPTKNGKEEQQKES